jgi:hypothetical protein
VVHRWSERTRLMKSHYMALAEGRCSYSHDVAETGAYHPRERFGLRFESGRARRTAAIFRVRRDEYGNWEVLGLKVARYPRITGQAAGTVEVTIPLWIPLLGLAFAIARVKQRGTRARGFRVDNIEAGDPAPITVRERN